MKMLKTDSENKFVSEGLATSGHVHKLETVTAASKGLVPDEQFSDDDGGNIMF